MEIERIGGTLEILAKRAKSYRLGGYDPYPFQLAYHRGQSGKWEQGHWEPLEGEAKQLLLSAGNQVGKCLSYQSLITHPDGTKTQAGKLYDAGKPFQVLSWDGEKLVAATVTDFIKKPPELIYRVWLDNGEWFECAHNHRVMLADGSYAFLGSLLEYVPCRSPTTLEHGLSTHALSVRHWFGIARGSLGRCFDYSRLYGERLLSWLSSALDAFPLQAYVQRRDDSLWQRGVLVNKYTSIRRQERARLSNRGVVRQNEAQFFAPAGQVCEQYALLWSCGLRRVLRYAIVDILGLPPSLLSHSPGCSSGAYLYSPKDGCNRIISYEVVSVNDIYDFTVPTYHNYLAAGVIHHNTECGGADVAIHATGDYPSWWEGPDLTERLRRYPLIWCGGKNNDRVRDIPQATLCGDPHDPGSLGTGWIPKDAIQDKVLKQGVRGGFDSVLVRHKEGFLVTIAFKSYDSALLDWAGQPVTLIWLDEEPPQIIYSQCLARTIASGGYIRMTFTPEQGATEVVSEFTTALKPGQGLMYVGWDDAKHPDGRTHMDPVTMNQLLAAFMPHEREMRVKGIPVLGSGAVFPLSLETILCDPFPIPQTMPVIYGLDFGRGGMNHPTAAVWLAFNPETKTCYVYDTYKSDASEVAIHAMAVRSRGAWIPGAWPHDGNRKESYATEGVALGYREMGLNLLTSHAVNEEDGSIAIEPGIFSMYRAMSEGRFKVFANLRNWQEEFRMYHRSAKDGSIIDRKDDLMSATRIGYISRRYARAADSGQVRRRETQAPGTSWNTYQE